MHTEAAGQAYSLGTVPLVGLFFPSLDLCSLALGEHSFSSLNCYFRQFWVVGG